MSHIARPGGSGQGGCPAAAAPATSQDQRASRLRGRIEDPRHHPVNGAFVRLVGGADTLGADQRGGQQPRRRDVDAPAHRLCRQLVELLAEARRARCRRHHVGGVPRRGSPTQSRPACKRWRLRAPTHLLPARESDLCRHAQRHAHHRLGPHADRLQRRPLGLLAAVRTGEGGEPGLGSFPHGACWARTQRWPQLAAISRPTSPIACHATPGRAEFTRVAYTGLPAASSLPICGPASIGWRSQSTVTSAWCRPWW